MRSFTARLSRSALGFVSIGLLAPASSAAAQEQPDLPPPAHIAYVDGAARLERDGEIQPASLNVPLVPGDRLTTMSGRVEVLFPDGTALDVDEDTSIDLLSDSLIRLTEGQVLLTIWGAADPGRALRYQIDTPAASVQSTGPGELRVEVRRFGEETELRVLRGSVLFFNERGSLEVRAGERSLAFEDGGPLRTEWFNSARLDAFGRWAAERRNERLAAAGAPSLPPELQPYGAILESEGSWEYAAPYGYVWYPNVAPDWRPYYMGYWDDVPSYGWVWVGVHAWAWPTHHYGRWGYARRGWFWIPGRVWAPAWVSWVGAADYVGWCPLGHDGRPVVGFSLSANVGFGWTILPRAVFGVRARDVPQYAVPVQRVPRAAAFAPLSAPPVPAGVRRRVAAGPGAPGQPLAAGGVRRRGGAAGGTWAAYDGARRRSAAGATITAPPVPPDSGPVRGRLGPPPPGAASTAVAAAPMVRGSGASGRRVSESPSAADRPLAGPRPTERAIPRYRDAVPRPPSQVPAPEAAASFDRGSPRMYGRPVERAVPRYRDDAPRPVASPAAEPLYRPAPPPQPALPAYRRAPSPPPAPRDTAPPAPLRRFGPPPTPAGPRAESTPARPSGEPGAVRAVPRAERSGDGLRHAGRR